MATRPRRRFPWLALLGVAVLGTAFALLAIECQVIPCRIELWLEQNTGIVEGRLFVMGIPISAERRSAWNAVSERYRELRGEVCNQQEWHKVVGWESWLVHSGTDQLLPPKMYAAFMIVNELVDHRGEGMGGNPITLEPTACDTLILRFMELVHSDADEDIVYWYCDTTWSRLFEIQRTVTNEDLIPLDTWLADPVPEHYYGPDRIH